MARCKMALTTLEGTAVTLLCAKLSRKDSGVAAAGAFSWYVVPFFQVLL